MLTALAIRDVVLIERADLQFSRGLSVLTGETGAGKSILLDALSLALGQRSDAGLVRPGAAQASVTASFEPSPAHPVWQYLTEAGLPSTDTIANEPLVLRRIVTSEGRSRAAINDQPVSAGLLRAIAASLIEIQGQFENHGLLDAAQHRAALDQYAGVTTLLRQTEEQFRAWRAAAETLDIAQQQAATSAAEADYRGAILAELTALEPMSGEEETLANARTQLMQREKLQAAIDEALIAITDETGAESRIALASRALLRLPAPLQEGFQNCLAALDRAGGELSEAVAALQGALPDEETAETKLEQIEERLFALRAIARKHRVTVDELPALIVALQAEVQSANNRTEHLLSLEKAAATARQTYEQSAVKLSAIRHETGLKLDRAVNAELPDLKLAQALFRTRIETLPPGQWNGFGIDRIIFEIATIPGTSPQALAKIASGGELSRLMLALKLVLASESSPATLIFDEVDSGIGGAVADAVGERLARLSRSAQIVVVTHSPQVAARGEHHWLITKAIKNNALATTISPLNDAERHEEIARMLSGKAVTAEARAAAGRLIAHAV